MVEQKQKLEKVTRSSLLKLLDTAYKSRDLLEQSAFNKSSQEWREQFVRAKEQVLDNYGITRALKNFNIKLKRLTGHSVYTDFGIEMDSTVYQEIIDMIGDEPKNPFVFKSDFDNRRSRHINDTLIIPALEKEYLQLKQTVIASDITIEEAVKMINDFGAGKKS